MGIIYLGGAITLFAHIWILIMAFRQSILWGVLCLCVPFANLIFCIIHFGRAKLALALLIIGGLVTGYGRSRVERLEWGNPTEFKV